MKKNALDFEVVFEFYFFFSHELDLSASQLNEKIARSLILDLFVITVLTLDFSC